MNDIQRQQIRELRAEGNSYGKISQALCLSENTVKTFCRRNGLGGVLAVPTHNVHYHHCKCCGVPVSQPTGRKEKKFCSDKCRMKWWNSHLDQVNRKANYERNCVCCGKDFVSYGNKSRKYCSHECYIEDRFRGGSHE